MHPRIKARLEVGLEVQYVEVRLAASQINWFAIVLPKLLNPLILLMTMTMDPLGWSSGRVYNLLHKTRELDSRPRPDIVLFFVVLYVCLFFLLMHLPLRLSSCAWALWCEPACIMLAVVHADMANLAIRHPYSKLKEMWPSLSATSHVVQVFGSDMLCDSSTPLNPA